MIRQITCEVCGHSALVGRSDAKYCGAKCGRIANFVRTSRGLKLLRGNLVVAQSATP